MPIPFHLVNAFTLSPSSPHSGNQASVVQLRPEDGKTDEWKQPVARDFGFAETAYVEEVSIDEETGVGEWGLRWWTPATVCRIVHLHSLRIALWMVLDEMGQSAESNGRRSYYAATRPSPLLTLYTPSTPS